MNRLVCFATAVFVACASASAATWSTAYAPAENLEKLDVALIDSARTRIDFAAYILTDVAVIDALAAAAGRGVAVRIYRDSGQETVAGFVADHLKRLVASPNVQVRTKASFTLMHLKSFAVDGRMLRGGAANFSASGLKHQDNDRWETDDAGAVDRFEHTFETMWAR